MVKKSDIVNAMKAQHAALRKLRMEQLLQDVVNILPIRVRTDGIKYIMSADIEARRTELIAMLGQLYEAVPSPDRKHVYYTKMEDAPFTVVHLAFTCNNRACSALDKDTWLVD
jgi:hypothetical protein